MEESSGNPVVSRKSRYFTSIESSYSLRKTPARSQSNKTSSPEHSNPSNVLKSQGNEIENSPKSLPRRYPSRIRVSAVQKSPSSSPRTPLKSRSKEESEESESRKRVKKTLHEFRGIYYKLVEGGEKEPGDTSRTDLAAYNLFKGRNKGSGCVNRCLGAAPGVEIGDKFNLRVEMFLVGLHCHLRANIDYVTKDERLVAASIVSLCSGRYSNNVRTSGDVMVCCGIGNEENDQRMEGGNLALKNSIDDETPVRVILGFRDGRKIIYVYGGLYSVEKYWSKKGEFGRKVFLFQLRRLEGQTKINIKEVMKSISSRTGSKDIEDKHLSSSKCTRKEILPSVHSPASSENSEISSKHEAVEGTNCFGKRGREQAEKSQASEAESRKRVKQTLHEFLLIYEKLAEEAEAKQEPKKKKETGERSRFDLDAYNLYKDKNKDLSNVTRCLGAVPGVEVGDKFHFRVELSLLGLHCQLQADIDYIRKGEKLLAVSIVSIRLGQYNSNVCKSDVLMFCGSGLKNRDQKMVNGNLALKNSIDAQTPVRVFHGLQNTKGAVLYVYCGLYLVEKYWRKKDNNGHYVFMFRLRRLPRQPKLDIIEAKKSLSFRSCSVPKYTEDISRGKEEVPIRVINIIDDECLQPIEYITEVIYPLNYSPAPLEGCDCVNGCSDSNTCACAVRNGGELPFNSKGAIVEAKPLVYACGPSCKCPPSCHNRVKREIKFPLEIFKTETMGWGVRSRTFIPSGSFICEYVGELLEDEEAQKRDTDEYLFAIGNNYYDESLWEGLSSVPCLQKSDSSEAEEDGGFTLDSSRYGNVGKFINHSCTPNLYAQNVLYDHDDKRTPHVMFFACEDIPPLQELSYHYNYIIDDVQDSDGNIRKKDCYCGSIECTGRLY